MPELVPTPKWITDSYRPETERPHYAVEVTADGFLLHEIDLHSINPYTFEIREMSAFAKLTGETVAIKGKLEDLYYWSRENLVEIIDTPGTEFSDALKADPNYNVPMSFGMPSSSIMQASLAAHAYKDFLKLVEHYEKNVNDPIVAFQFIDAHPMYWHFVKHQPRVARRRSQPKAPDGSPYEGLVPNPAALPEPRIELETGHGWMRVQVEIISGKFSFETSGTPYHTQTNYHDYGLDVYSKSMDEGICELAAKIHAKYDLDGNLRNGDDEPNGFHE
jgi:hypothetical protein